MSKANRTNERGREGSSQPAADEAKVALTVRVSPALAQMVAGYAILRGETKQEYLLDIVLKGVEADCGCPYYNDLPEVRAAEHRQSGQAELVALPSED